MFRNPLADGLVVLVLLLLFFGPKRLPMLSRSIGESIKEFKGGITDASSEKEELPAAKPDASSENGELPAAKPDADETNESASQSKTSA